MDKKFLKPSQALEEIIDEFRHDPQYDIFAEVYSSLVGGKTIVGKNEDTSFMGLIRDGIWHQPENSEEKKFYSHHDYDDLLTYAFSAKKPSVQQVVEIYIKATGLKASIGSDAEGNTGIWVETEMEKFRCIQCGHCCLYLSGAIHTCAEEEDVERWESEGRDDILSYIEVGDLWIDPETGDDVLRCPWLIKRPNKNKYICRIHETKPKHCRDFPTSKKHALRSGCKGFD